MFSAFSKFGWLLFDIYMILDSKSTWNKIIYLLKFKVGETAWFPISLSVAEGLKILLELVEKTAFWALKLLMENAAFCTLLLIENAAFCALLFAGTENSLRRSRGPLCCFSEYIWTPCTVCTCWTRLHADSELILQNEQMYSRGSEIKL